jgi:ABC-type transporter Mla MlaB component
MTLARWPIVLAGAIARSDIPLLCERLRAMMEQHDLDLIDCEVSNILVDLVAIEALARLQLTARRHGCRMCLVGAPHELESLLVLCGLGGVF